MARRPALRALAERLGILSEYTAQDRTRRRTTDESRVALIAAMGIDASEEATARRALAALEREAAARFLVPARVVRGPSRHAPRLKLTVPEAAGTGVDWLAEVEDETGSVRQAQGRAEPRRPRGTFSIQLPLGPRAGYYRVRAAARWAQGEQKGEQLLVIAPPSCHPIRDALGARWSFGVIANLWSLKSTRNWGAGDLSDLGELVEWCGALGGAFVGLNPLHALRNRGSDISPYNPVSRLYRNVVYLDVEAVPELAECREAQSRIASPDFQTALASLRSAPRVDYEAVVALKRPVLEALHRTFRQQPADSPRSRAYREYLDREGESLTDFATFMALGEHFGQGRPAGRHDWPAAYAEPRAEAVTEFRRTHQEAVDFHRYIQFELDRQLATVAGRARRAGLAIGLYQDLAVGTAAGGSDPWAFPGLFARGARVGAPPDDYSAVGQDWGFPPVDPHRLQADRYRYWILLLRAAFAHAGALRLDHAMGLLRLFWIPPGCTARDGVYVRYPAHDLLGILALESRRHRAVVVGEDLGTVPRGFQALLARWNILSSRVLYFERDRHGAFRPASRYSRRALVTANTHDHPTLAGYRRGRDLELRREAGQLPTDSALGQARAAREREVAALERRLVADGLLSRSPEAVGEFEFAGAVHGFLARTPAPLVGLSLDDLVGEGDPVNLPGVGLQQYSSWTRRLRVPLEWLAESPVVGAAIGRMGERIRRLP